MFPKATRLSTGNFPRWLHAIFRLTRPMKALWGLRLKLFRILPLCQSENPGSVRSRATCPGRFLQQNKHTRTGARMIHPIGNQLASSSLGLAAPMSERQQAQPDPAVQVAPVEDTQSGRFDKQADQRALGLRQPIEPPQSSLEKALESVNNSLKAWSTGIRF